MSAGHRSTVSAKDEVEVRRLLSRQDIQAFLEIPYTVDYSRPVPLTGGSNVTGNKYFIDPDVPRGDRKYVLWHERVEKALRSILGFSYDRAHAMATAAEKNLAGKNWLAYDARMRKIVKFNERRGPKKEPPDFDPGPYEGKEKKLLKRAEGGQAADYDYDAYQQDPDMAIGPGLHGPDTYKLPNHPTFSDESIYNQPGSAEGGHWSRNNDGTWTFAPGAANLQHFTPQQLRDYFNRIEPGNKLRKEGGRVISKARKKSHASVNYGIGTRAKHCGICTMYVKGGHCTAVVDPISPEMWCKLFKKKT